MSALHLFVKIAVSAFMLMFIFGFACGVTPDTSKWKDVFLAICLLCLAAVIVCIFGAVWSL